MKKNLLFISIFLVSLMSLSIQGMEQHSHAIESQAIDQSGRNLGALGTLPNELLYRIIDQGLPAQINTIQELEQAWNFIAHFAQINRHCAGMVQDEFISTIILARKISKDKADELWKHFLDNFRKIQNNHTWLRIVDALIRVADVNMKEDSYGWTALMRAAGKGHKEIVALLLQHGADVNIKDYDGWTALMMASLNGYKEVVALLLQHGADVTLQGNRWVTATDLASTPEIRELLLAARKNAEQNNNNNA